MCCPNAANEMAATLNLATLNVNGLHMSDKRGGVFRWLWSLPVSVDVVCLQETHCVSEEVSFVLLSYPFVVGLFWLEACVWLCCALSASPVSSAVLEG